MSSLYITKYMNNILDINDLNKSFRQFKKDIVKYDFSDYDEIYCNKKDKLQMRFHQKLLVEKTCNNIIDHIFVDGNRFNTYCGKDKEFVSHTCIVDGDAKLFQIAAASILAKTYRDKYIADLGNSCEELKVYKWEKNKGYGTKEHTDAIKAHGISAYHRKTFIHF